MAISSDKQTWIYTNYGLNRIAAAMNNSSTLLYLYKIKVGDANGSFYIPTASATSLVNVKDEFFIHAKGILEDNITTYFNTVFTENSDGYEIREIGLYETINNVDYLFAISTCQPISKPFVEDNYIISIDYTLNIKSTNLASVYAQIMLDAESTYVTQDDFDALQNTFLFMEGNLMEQISHNSHIIGLNRAEQLYEKITQNSVWFSNMATTLAYTNLIETVTIGKIYSYWVFNYSKDLTGRTSVIDLSTNYNYLSLNKNMNLFNKDYIGLAPCLDIDDSNYFTLGADIDFDLLNSGKTDDSEFTMIYLLKNNLLDTKNTLLAKSNYSNNKNIFEINKLADNSIEVKLFTNSSNYVKCLTLPNVIPSDMYCLVIRYNGNKTSPLIDIFINFNKLVTTQTITGSYTGMPNTALELTPYTTSALGLPQDNINSTVSILSIVKDSIEDSLVKTIMLNMMALSGKDVCLIV